VRSWHARLVSGRAWTRRRLLGLMAATAGCSLMVAPLGGGGPAWSGPRGTVWVTNQTLNTVAAYDARTGALLRTVGVGAKPIGVVAPPGTDKVYVSNESDDTISVIDRRGGATSLVKVGDGPHHMVHSTGGRFVYFGEFNANTVGVIDTRDDSYRHFVASASPTAKTHAVWISRDGRTLYAVNSEADTFTALDAATGTPRWFDVPVGDQPSEVLVTRNGRTAYISIRAEDKIGVFDLTGGSPRKVAEVAVGDQPDTLQLTPDGRTLVVALRGSFASPVGAGSLQPTSTAARVDLVDTRGLRVRSVWIAGATTTGHQWLSADGRRTFVAIESVAGSPLPPGVAVIDNRRGTVVATWAYPGDGRPHGAYFEAGGRRR
jgi:YVTN family beta-propeller protein